jgi:hypothetical protein
VGGNGSVVAVMPSFDTSGEMPDNGWGGGGWLIAAAIVLVITGVRKAWEKYSKPIPPPPHFKRLSNGQKSEEIE